jgi:putative DNA methylase
MTDFPIKAPRKLIEVALPLDAINKACAYEKMPGIGAHPRGIHLWWARRPLAAARAVIFSQLVNDPSWKWEMEHPGEVPPNNLKGSWAASRKRLFKIIEELVLWENTTNEDVLNRAREEIRKSWRETCELNKDHPQAAELFNPDKLPALHDPFAGGGAIPLEAQRLGLEAYASDLNPVAVLINKAMIEIPPKFAGKKPVHPSEHGATLAEEWHGAQGLAEDVRYYGAWMRAEAQKRIGHLYPPVEITQEMAGERPDLRQYVGQKLTVIAWLWARTVKSPNPAFSHVDVPLASTFILSSKSGKEAYVQPVIEGDKYRFTVKVGTPPAEAELGTSSGKRKAFRCLISNVPIDYPYIREEGKAGRMGQKLMAIVAEGTRGRVYIAPTQEMEAVAAQAKPTWKPDCLMPKKHRNFQPPVYGMDNLGDLFTPRQLVALTTFSDLVAEARERIRRDALAAGLSVDNKGLEEGGTNAKAYAEAVSVYLAFAVDRCADFNNSGTRWVSGNQKVMNLFGKQAIAMTWDYPEAAILHDTVGGFSQVLSYMCDCLKYVPATLQGKALQRDAQNQDVSRLKSVSTDPPYYDNIAYADLSDFFYVWLRKCLCDVFSLFSTITVPKAEELVASPYKHGGADAAERFFLSGMEQALSGISLKAHPHAPITIYYAFKQSETKEEGTSSKGWVSFLEALTRAGLQLTGTWPLRSEQEYRMISMGTNALASSIVLVCRKRAADAPTISRREFIRELNAVLPEALDEMTKGADADRSPVAPVDLSQAIIGPGMAVFSKYSAVLEADGKPMSVRAALQLINRFLAEDDFDADTQWCLRWFEQNGWAEGAFGEADVLARAKATSVSGLSEAGVVQSGGGKVALLKWADYPKDWNPLTDKRNPVWETLHHLIRALKNEGEASAGSLLSAVAGQGESVRQLAYRLYTLCERRGWAEDARAYNELITSWAGIEQSAATHAPIKQEELF